MATAARLSPTARRLLNGHKPGIPGYLSWALGPQRDERALVAIDAAYAELVEAGLVKRHDSALCVLPGVSRCPFLLAVPAKAKASD